MVCTFFGHRNIEKNIKERLESEINSLISAGVERFLVGNNGYFDYLAQILLEKLSSSNKNIKYEIVLSYINEKAISGNQHSTVFPEELELVPLKFRISKRNSYLIKSSDIAVVYVNNKFTNSYKWAKRAEASGLKLVYLLDKI